VRCDDGLPLDEILPVVVLSEPVLELEDVVKSFGIFSKMDDVFSKAFERTLIVQNGVGVGSVQREQFLNDLDKSGRFSAVLVSQVESSNDLLPSGPYFLRGQNLYQAWRLYPDDLDAFIFAVIPEDVRNPCKCVLKALS
jgi:hypothetical protein